MKPFIVLAALVAASQAAPAQDSLVQSVVRAKWASYKAQHGKQYSAEEESQKMTQYLEATKTIEEHNARFHAGLESFEMGHNAHSDLTLQELAATKMGIQMPANFEAVAANATFHITPSNYKAPASSDWRAQGGIWPVKDQGQCGSCYAFSAMGALENAHWRKYRTLPNLSEQHCVDCSRRAGCDGGWMHEVFAWVQSNRGVSNQANYPYKGVVGTCRSAPAATNVATYNMVSNENALMSAISVGAVSIAYNANTQQHSYYQRGVLDIPNCGTTPTHAVLLVGYGNEGGKDYWLLKNSWGTSWGEQGYFKLRRGQNQCGVASYASYPTAV
jgi:cathepsin L